MWRLALALPPLSTFVLSPFLLPFFFCALHFIFLVAVVIHVDSALSQECV